MNNDVIFRLEQKEDYAYVENMIRDSFWNVYRPGCFEHYLMHNLRKDKDFVKELDIVMELDNEIIGQASFVKSTLTNQNNNEVINILTLGPICIANAYKRKGYGRKLLDYVIDKAKRLEYVAIFLEGNIDFYGKCGFVEASKFNISYFSIEENTDCSFFLCKELIPNSLQNYKGIYKVPTVYCIDENKAIEYDNKFPYKEKLVLPGQLDL